MPTYAYRCPNCGHEYDKFQKISDSTRARCPKCRKRGEHVISVGGGLLFKGSGFYVTDYKRAGEKRPPEETAKTDGAKAEPAASKKPRTESKGRAGKRETGAES